MTTRDFDGLVCDLDGVLYRGDEPIEGAARAIDRLREQDVRVLFCTNNSRATVMEYRDKLADLGVPAGLDDILTSAVVTAEAMSARHLRGRAIVIGGRGLRESLAEVGVEAYDGDDHVAAVVVGLDTGFDYAALTRATGALLLGAPFIATNDDATFPAPGGRVWPGAGAIVASMEAASGRRAEVMGKPHRPMMEAAERRLSGCRNIAVVGDRPETDLRGADAMGWKTILVLSGVTSREGIGAIRPRPEVVLNSIAELAN